MFERFAAPTRDAVRFGMEEAGRRGDRRLGTDHLLLGVLHDTGTAELIGVTVAQARSKSDELDRAALVAVGIDIGDYRPPVAPRAGKRTPLTSGARTTLQRTVIHTTADKSRRILPKHLLLALLDSEKPDPAVTLLTEMGVDLPAVRLRLTAR